MKFLRDVHNFLNHHPAQLTISTKFIKFKVNVFFSFAEFTIMLSLMIFLSLVTDGIPETSDDGVPIICM